MDDILTKLSAGMITQDEAKAEIDKLNEEKSNKKQIYYKVAPKGGISFYGMQSRPITIYINHLESILNEVCSSEWKWNEEFEEFLKENEESLSRSKSKKSKPKSITIKKK